MPLHAVVFNTQPGAASTLFQSLVYLMLLALGGVALLNFE